MSFEHSFKKYHTVRTFFQPTSIVDLCISNQLKSYLNYIVHTDHFHVLFYGDKDSGKTSILNCILNEYYHDVEHKEEYIMKIQGLCEHSMTILKSDILSFCKFPVSIKKRTIVVDDIDLLNSNGYDIILKCLDYHKTNINMIITCVDKYKLCDQILSRLNLIQCIYDKEIYAQLFHMQLEKLPFKLKDKMAYDVLMKHSHFSFRILHSLFDKLIYYGNKEYSSEDIVSICGCIDFNVFETYTKYWREKNIIKANMQLAYFLDKGYTVVDILELYFTYIKSCDILSKKMVLKVIQYISEYITYFYSIHENSTELYFLTYELIMLV